jgi:hypothetical protein
MGNICCNQSLTHFASYNGGVSVMVDCYHCDKCSNNYFSSDYVFTTAGDMKPSSLEKSDSLDGDYEVYKRLCELNKVNPDIDVDSYMNNYMHLPDKEDHVKFLLDLTDLEKAV